MGALGHRSSTGDTRDWPVLQAQWARLGNTLLDLIFPRRCGGCGKPGREWCDACRAQIRAVGSSICPHCGRPQPQSAVCPHCRHTPLEINGIRSAVMFEGPAREAIHHLKYNGRTSLAEPLGDLLIESWQANPLPADMLVPVPLHQARLRERGYNQSALLGKRLAQATGLPLIEPALRRVKATVPQITLTAAERKANVQDAFEARAELVGGKRVLLIDDVCTTGSTLEACQLALKRASAQSVWALTLARAP